MKIYCNKIIVFISLLFSCLFVTSQDLATIKTDWQQGDIARAKEAIDNYTSTEPDSVAGWLLKARIYNSISSDVRFKELVADSRMIAFKAVEKATVLNKDLVAAELEKEDFSLLTDIYKGYTSNGITFFNAGTEKQHKEDYATALINFKKASQVNSFQHSNGWGGDEPDINNLYYSALSAIYADKTDDAYFFCRKIADNKIVYNVPDKDFEPAYQWLVYYLRKKKNDELLLNYTPVANSLFPESEYFSLNFIDRMRELNEVEKMLGEYNTLLTKKKTSIKTHKAYTRDLFNAAYNMNAAADKKKMLIETLQNALTGFTAKFPGDDEGFLMFARHYINQAAGIKKDSAISDLMKKNNIHRMLNESNVCLRKITGRKNQSANEVIKEAMELLISNYTALGDTISANQYKKALLRLNSMDIKH